MDDLKEKLLKLLDEDEEFRRKLADYLCVSELSERIDRLEKAHDKLWEGLKTLRENHRKLWEMQLRSSRR